MIVYNDIKRQFVNDVMDNSIADKILDAIRERGLNAGHDREYSSWKKRTIIIQGGPGTGKSVLAVNLLMEYINQHLNASYVTKNSAPREAFSFLTKTKQLRQKISDQLKK